MKTIKLFFNRLFKCGIAVDYYSIQKLVFGAKELTPVDILELYHKSNVLFYRSLTDTGEPLQPPIILKRGLFNLKPTFIDWNKLTYEQKQKIIDKI